MIRIRVGDMLRVREACMPRCFGLDAKQRKILLATFPCDTVWGIESVPTRSGMHSVKQSLKNR